METNAKNTSNELKTEDEKLVGIFKRNLGFQPFMVLQNCIKVLSIDSTKVEYKCQG